MVLTEEIKVINDERTSKSTSPEELDPLQLIDGSSPSRPAKLPSLTVI